MYFTNPSKLSYDMALSNTWAVTFNDDTFNILESISGIHIFPASDVQFKELSVNNMSLNIGIGGVLDLSSPSSVTRTTVIDIPFIDSDNQDINTAIRNWIKASPPYTQGRAIHFTKSSSHTKEITLYKLKKDGSFIAGDAKLTFTVFPTEELVQSFNSNIEFRIDKLSLRCY